MAGFFDQISKTITQGVDRARFEAEKFQKTTRLQGEVNEIQRQLDEKLMEMGRRAYDLQRAGQISVPSIAELSRSVDQMQTNLVTKQEELKAAQNEVFIDPANPGGVPPRQAQSVPISYDAPTATPAQAANPPSPPAYTPPPPPAQSIPTTKACKSCSFVMPSTAMFCPNCGTRS